MSGPKWDVLRLLHDPLRGRRHARWPRHRPFRAELVRSTPQQGALHGVVTGDLAAASAPATAKTGRSGSIRACPMPVLPHEDVRTTCSASPAASSRKPPRPATTR